MPPQARPVPTFVQMLDQVMREQQQRRYYAPAGEGDYRYRQGPPQNGTGHLLSDQMGRSPRGNNRREFVEEQGSVQRVEPPDVDPRELRVSPRENRVNPQENWDPRMQQNPRHHRPGERQGLFGNGKALFGAREADKNEQVKMNKVEFNARDERGVVKELWLPDGFRADADNDQTQRLYTKDDTGSKFSIYGGRDLSDEESSSLQTVLSQKKE
jgi:hypothetical protein